MFLIPCPHCGKRAQAEFAYERVLESVIVPGQDDDAAMDKLFTRTNSKGLEEELWRHTYGCRAWIVIRRNRVTHEILEVRPIGPEALA